jgi:DNA-binding MarR family transcriptional regulator
MAEKSPSPELIARARHLLNRLSRFTNRLQRTQLACGPVTVQQCYTLEALMGGPLSMKTLAEQVAMHQSTLTRIVEKLEAKALVVRKRRSDNQRVVEVTLSEQGRELYAQLDQASSNMIGRVLGLVSPRDQASALRGLEVLCNLLDPGNTAAQALIAECGCGAAASLPSACASGEA